MHRFPSPFRKYKCTQVGFFKKNQIERSAAAAVVAAAAAADDDDDDAVSQ